MRNPRRTTAAVLAGAAVLASGAYAIGNEQGDGGAIAASSRAADTAEFRPMVGPAPGPPPGAGRDHLVQRAPVAFSLRRTARKLGVTPRELRAALRDVRPERPERMPLFGGLADTLGVTESQLRDAFGQVHSDHERGDREAELGDALGVSEDELRAAFEELHDRRGRGGDPAQALADALGIEKSRVTEAFETLRDQKEAQLATDLADALGIDESTVKTALDEQRAEAEDRHEQMRADFVSRLADALGIPESRVEDTLPAMPHPPGHGPGPGHGPW